MTAIRLALACALLGSSGSVAVAAQPQVVFVVRHAERPTPIPAPAAAGGERPMGSAADDPPLSDAGQARAVRLEAMLRSADILQVFVSEFLRTRQTAAPTAAARSLEVVAVPAKDVDALVAQIREAKGNVLVVGHANTVPDLLKRLGIKDDITIADGEYDNLFVVIRPSSGEPTLVRLRY